MLVPLAVVACGEEPTAPPERVPRAGRYVFMWDNPALGRVPARHYSGALLLVEASPERIAGVWAVNGFMPAVEDGRWNDDMAGYRLVANAVLGGQVIIWVSRAVGHPPTGADILACGGRLSVDEGRGATQSSGGTCSIWYNSELPR
jgi:hypothetical protein